MPTGDKSGNGPPRGSLRSLILFLVGVGLIVYEAGWSQTDRPWLYGVALVMMGLVSPEVIIVILETVGLRRGNAK